MEMQLISVDEEEFIIGSELEAWTLLGCSKGEQCLFWPCESGATTGTGAPRTTVVA